MRYFLCVWMGVCLWLGGCSKQAAPQIGDACASITDCALTPGLACINDECVKRACERTLDCPVDAACVDELCSGAECLVDADCGQGSCFEGDCRTDLCTTRQECEQGLVCRGRPSQCQEPLDACALDEECPVGQACKPETSRCVQACSLISACDEGSWCDEGVCRAQCTLPSECEATERCIQGLCRAPLDCSMSDPCPVDALLRDAYSCECVSCFNEQDCQLTEGEVCIDGACTRCESAPQHDLSCAAQNLAQASELCCVECLSDADCEAGSLCERGECLDTRRRSCEQDADCPSPLFCDGRLCVSSASLAPCVLQSDCSPGEACFGDGRCRQQADTCAAGCRAPSRCIGALDTVGGAGSCVGCQEACSAEQCPDGTRCYLPEEAQEGWCVVQSFWRQICTD
jgi:hypothetical protein